MVGRLKPQWFSSHCPVSPNPSLDVSQQHVSQLTGKKNNISSSFFLFVSFGKLTHFDHVCQLMGQWPVHLSGSQAVFELSLLSSRRDLSALLCVHTLHCEIWHDSNCRGFKPQFVTLLTQERNMDSDFRLWKQNSAEKMFV